MIPIDKRCPGSWARRPISVAEEMNRKALCSVCGRYLGIRPTRNDSFKGKGTPVATLPGHKMPLDDK
jgi:hypothetical protein